MARFSNDPVCSEKQLLAFCALTRADSRVVGEIRRLLSLPLDWDFVAAAAAEHGVAPLLLRHILSDRPDSVPRVQLDRLKDHVRAATVRSLVLAAELIRILDAFFAAKIRAVPYKGPVLAMQAYGDIALREFVDLDLVLRQRDVAAANGALAQLGYSPGFPSVFAPGDPASLIPGEYDYHHAERRLTIELHTERTLRHFPVRPDLDELGRRLAPVSLSGHEIRTFGPEDTLVFICVHGAKDFWARLVWVADVAGLLASHPQLDWGRVFAFADSVRGRRMVHLGLALAGKMFGISAPEAVRSRVEDDAIAIAWASQLQQRLLSRAAEPLGARATFAYRRHMVHGAFAGVRYAIRLATAPAAEDWHTVRLPRRLAPLYVAFRPLRLLRKYGVPGGIARPSS